MLLHQCFFYLTDIERWAWVAYRTRCCVIRVLHGCHACSVCNMTQPECCPMQAVWTGQTHPWYMILVFHRFVMSIDGNTPLVMCRWKITAEIQDGWRKDAEGIRNVEKHLWQFFDFRSFITHFSQLMWKCNYKCN